jgi:hypothetical protein
MSLITYKMRTLGWLLLAVSLRLTALAQEPRLETRQLLGGRVELLVPAGFTTMTREMIQVKYPNRKPPQFALSDERAATNVALTWSETKATQATMPSFETYLYSSTQKAQPQAVWYDHGLQTIGGRQVAFMEMLTPVPDGQVYNLLFFTDVDGRLLIITFNCLKEELEIWRPKAKEIMASLQVKKR